MKVKNPWFLLILIVLTVCLTYAFLYLTPQAHVRHVEREYAAAIEQLNQSPPGIPRAEEFIQQLRAIDVEHAPLEIQQDLREYTDTLDQAVQTLKEGGKTTVYDQKIGEEKDRLAADFKKYN
jgi:hypothetical protein